MNCRIEAYKKRPNTLFLLALLLALGVSGCATPRERTPIATRAFNFKTDTFAYSNQLVWEYSFATNGEWSAHKHVPPPDYALHCFPMTRAAERFFFNARFDATQPKTSTNIYQQLIHTALCGTQQKVIPGYANLREFSAAQEALLKAECGGAWRSYVQRGNWRMVFPFTRTNQARTAEHLAASLHENKLPIIHLSRFPQLTINHAVLLFAIEESEPEIRFSAYDPNIPDTPVTLTFDRASRTFYWPRSHYFGGGRVNVYQIYHRWNY